MSRHRVGLVGARGYAGREMLLLIQHHPDLELGFAASRGSAGRPLREAQPAWEGDDIFVAASPEQVAQGDFDALILAMPNGAALEYVGASSTAAPIVDLSADHRFDPDWTYGLPELHRGDITGARRIANPGCYATAAMLALAPIADRLAGEPSAFGISGYSGAGTVPSPRNDPALLADNVMPYTLTGHMHEREIEHQLGRSVRFAPTVAPFERGLVVTVLAELTQPQGAASLEGLYHEAYDSDPLVTVGAAVPLPRDAAGDVGATIGGFSVDPEDRHRIGLAATLDNLLKGASSQAMQNLNLALGLDPLAGLQ